MGGFWKLWMVALVLDVLELYLRLADFSSLELLLPLEIMHLIIPHTFVVGR